MRMTGNFERLFAMQAILAREGFMLESMIGKIARNQTPTSPNGSRGKFKKNRRLQLKTWIQM